MRMKVENQVTVNKTGDEKKMNTVWVVAGNEYNVGSSW